MAKRGAMMVYEHGSQQSEPWCRCPDAAGALHRDSWPRGFPMRCVYYTARW
jgi:hypothetical protein